MVADPETMTPVPQDGKTMGELMMRGNTVMKGYLSNPESTSKTLVGDWYLSGDLAVWHPDGYIEIKDRSKDIIISGGENISTLEVEEVLSQHPAVLFAAVVAQPDPTWGETPCAFLELKPDSRGQRDRDHPVLPAVPGSLQGAQAGGLRRTAEDFHRQDPEIHAARAGGRRELIECSVPLQARKESDRGGQNRTVSARGDEYKDVRGAACLFTCRDGKWHREDRLYCRAVGP